MLFAGESESGRYKGKAGRFSKGLPPIEYDVDGPILGGGNKVVLSGRAPRIDSSSHISIFPTENAEQHSGGKLERAAAKRGCLAASERS